MRRDRPRDVAMAVLVILAIGGLTLSILVGVVELINDGPGLLQTFAGGDLGAIDGRRHLAAAALVLQGGDPYTIEGFLYSPLAAWAMVPFAALGVAHGLAAWFALKIGLLALCLVDATKGWPIGARLAAALVAFTWAFALADLWMGNVTIPIACAMYLAVSRDRRIAGVPLGIVLATVAKPLLLPFLLWLLIFRRAAFTGALVTSIATTLAGLIVLGPDPYGAYLHALAGAGRFMFAFPGNLGLTAVAPQLLVPVSVLLAAVYLVLLRRSRDESALLLWSLLLGLIASPYVALYGPTSLLVGALAFARAHPVRALLAATVAPLMFVNLVAGVALLICLATPMEVLPARLRLASSARSVPVVPPASA